MKQASLVLMGLSISSGIGGALLLAANLVIYAILTFWIGSVLAFIGFALVIWALRPRRGGAAPAKAKRIEEARFAVETT